MKLVVIFSCRYSGSTVLSFMLGSHSQALSLTELRHFLAAKHHLRRDFFCKVCQPPESCPVWTKSLTERLINLGPTGEIFKVIANQSGKSLLIETSKLIDDWGALILKGLDPDNVLCVHLSKSPEEYAGSERNRFHWAPIHQIGDIANKWWRTNEKILDFVDNIPYKSASIRYRDLIDHPKEICRFLLAQFGLQYESGMEEFWKHKHHPLHGNPGAFSHLDTASIPDGWHRESELNKELYAAHHQSLYRDEKWRQTLTREEVDRLYSYGRVKQIARLLGYGHPFTQEGRLLNKSQEHWVPRKVVGSAEHRKERWLRRFDVNSWKPVDFIRRHGISRTPIVVWRKFRGNFRG